MTPDAPPNEPRITALIVLLLILSAFAFQGSRALWDPDEGRYTAVALQMLESGDWIVPRLNEYQQHLTKPPMTYWALATSMALFGHNEWAVRLPNALAFVLTGLMVFGLGRMFVPQRPWLPPLVWGSSVLTVLAANMVGTDTLLTLFETAAMYAWLSGRAASPGLQLRWRLLMWIALGLAFFTKGPPGVLPLLPILVVEGLEHGWRGAARVFDWRGVALFLLLGGWWFVALVIKRPELFDYFLGYELRDRLFSDVHKRNPQWYGAFKIYVPMLGLVLLPWILLGIGWLGGPWRARRAAWWRACWQQDRERMILLLWILLPLLVFCLARSRLYLYVLPLAAPIALLIGRDLSRRLPTPLTLPWKALLCAWPLAVLALKGYSSIATSAKDARQLALVAQRAAPDADRVMFSDVTARYGMRFYLNVPVEQDGTPHSSSKVALEQTVGSLCVRVRTHPNALIITRGLAMGPRMLPEIAPTCDGIVFRSLQPESGLWRVDWQQSTLQPDATVARPRGR